MPKMQDIIDQQFNDKVALRKDIKSLENQLEAADQHVVILQGRLDDESDRCDRQQERLSHRALHIRRLERLLAFYLGDPE